MRVRSLCYFLGEALKSILRNGWMSIASIGVVAITLLILGSFMIISFNVNLFTQDVKEQVQIVLYIDEAAGEETRLELERRLVSHPKLQEMRFVSKEEAMERLKRKMGDQAYLLDGYEGEEDNPLRDSYELRTIVPEDITAVAKEIENYPGVGYVDYGSGIVEPLFQFTGLIRLIGLAFMVGLGVTAVFLIAHTIRLTVYIRRKEIMIMKYVGATDWFIRWPFIFEGSFLGMIGAIIPVLIIYYGYQAAVFWIQSNIHFIPMMPPQDVTTEIIKLLLPLGIGLGMLGSVISVRRFLKV
ncbi:MAG TPA: ABC transporter permease [Firmicutes bacterium]|jgi:cell division transport system permease protein|nr:ABC transporter permease [Bacillota bacterium]